MGDGQTLPTAHSFTLKIYFKVYFTTNVYVIYLK